MAEVWDFFVWLLRQSAPPILVASAVIFVFKEKWKQILARSLQSDLERQRHEFARELEAYKTSLIAQAEGVKLRNDVQKTITNRYVEGKFDSLMALEKHLSTAGMTVQLFLALPARHRQADNLGKATEAVVAFQQAWAEAEMHLDRDEQHALVQVHNTIAKMLDHVGPGKAVYPVDSPEGNELLQHRVAAQKLIRDKIHALAEI